MSLTESYAPADPARRACVLRLLALPAIAGAPAVALAAGPAAGLDRPGSVPMTERGAAAMADALQGRQAQSGRVHLNIPKLAENGLSVPLELRVDSPMSAADHVRRVDLIAPVNPNPLLARVHFGPRSGQALLRTRVRLADTQDLYAFALMSDGSVWSGQTHVIVTLGGCIDPVL